ncbi:MAG: hypothetical protein J5J00_04425 [Deltaproteobacteria bacterium]|nr:hypothetical protein [Deltaproteobacteria bacterium]
MDMAAFIDSIESGALDKSLPKLLQAMWFDARGDWNRAHEIAQEDESAKGALVHAYLHRKEGDLGNARYWYSRAGVPQCRGNLSEEWQDLVNKLLAGE